MDTTTKEIITFIEENDVKFIRLAFCDVFGKQKNISIMPSQISRAFEEGISFDASAIAGFQHVQTSDMIVIPDASTLDILPWRPQEGRVIRFFCDICYPDKTPYEADTRVLLRKQIQQIQSDGYQAVCGLECEFYIFKLDEQGNPTWIPQDQASYLDMSPKDQGENVRRDICLTLEEMGITPESSHHEQGPGQNEIDFRFDDALLSCDQFTTFKWVVETVASIHHTWASFLAKPLSNKSGSGLHINLSLANTKGNAFSKEEPQLMGHFIAGILAHIKEITLFLNPLPNSYTRFGEFEAPKYISWGHANRSALIRVPSTSPTYTRAEIRSGDPTCNPYLATMLLLAAGMEGIHKQLPLPCEAKGNLNILHPDLAKLPSSIEEAIVCAQESDFVKRHIPHSIMEAYRIQCSESVL